MFDVGEGGIFFEFREAFQRVGPAFLLPNVIAILGRVYEPRSRKQSFAVLMAAPWWSVKFRLFLVCAELIEIRLSFLTVLLNDTRPKGYQGSSLMNTLVNYSVSLTLGFAGTAEDK